MGDTDLAKRQQTADFLERAARLAIDASSAGVYGSHEAALYVDVALEFLAPGVDETKCSSCAAKEME